MFLWALIPWLVGLLSAVPYGIYYLLFYAPREQYAFLITLILFWIFGYWSIVGPILTALKVRKILQAISMARSQEELEKAMNNDARNSVITAISAENKIPRFLAKIVYRLLIDKLKN